MRKSVKTSFNVMRMFYTGSGLYVGLAVDSFVNSARWWAGCLYILSAIVWYFLGYNVERSYLYGYMWKCDHKWERAKGIPNAESCECGAVRFTDEE